ncbi:KTSC domain-containing protein [Granulicella sp. dw_53]|uniref:KTSC domain-containing protein n=1 Tax=Granulicella sp. dw_53 TaxID=2719792 RepID=UPI001BD3F99D|nr:KTSC domain-containing protein [Granulicella sp. dw_53]
MPSTVIAAMSYEPQTKVLTIVYRGGRGTYRYFEVPEEEYAAFRAAPSKGTYLNETFKARGYRFERVRSPRSL